MVMSLLYSTVFIQCIKILDIMQNIKNNIIFYFSIDVFIYFIKVSNAIYFSSKFVNFMIGCISMIYWFTNNSWFNK